MIRLVAKKKLGFRVDGKLITVRPYEFATLPDAVAADPLYKWALADGSIEVAGEKEESVQVVVHEEKPEKAAEEEPVETKAKSRRKK